MAAAGLDSHFHCFSGDMMSVINLENMETLSFSGAVMFLFGRIQTLHPSFETLYLFMLHRFILKVMLRHLTEKTEDSRAEHNLSHLVIIIDYYIEIT